MRLTGFARIAGWCAALLVLMAVQGCATVTQPDARDPMESFNRAMFGFNDKVDQVVLKPVATGYKAVTPNWFRKGVGNFFNNLEDIWSAVNNGLQGRGQDFSDSVGRVMVNSTLGLFGLIDVASEFNIDRHTADFGLTLGRWGVPPGPYVVLPILGPRTLREVAALPVDINGQPVYNIGDSDTRTWLPVVYAVDTRAKYLGASDVLDGAALDAYAFRRDAYFQRQRNIQYDGNPPDDPADTPAEDTTPADPSKEAPKAEGAP